MSSEGSVTSSGSRIRQFGLYRTIDARTEEFLRSSRKRQIRQGCACAAISTAITVTVVVSVILVYEYINSESNVNKKISQKPNWIGLMNESDISSISTKFNKKINFDRTTLKLLPILLKALNKNRYLEKILEDYSSSSPPFVGKDSTEATFTRNIFADSKNWLKMPSMKHYTYDYKTSPLMYWKNPTQRLEYLTKIRKIRDYQRMLNYFDKMINDKVGSNLRREFEYTEDPAIAATVPMKIENKQKVQQLNHSIEKPQNVKQYITEDNEGTVSTGCKCPKKLGQMLSKLIGSIQNMIPHMGSNKPQSCANKTKSIEILPKFTTSRAVKPRKTIRKLRWPTTSQKPKTKTRKSTSTSTTCSTTSSTTTSAITSSTKSRPATTIVTATLSTTEINKRSFEDTTIHVPIMTNTLLYEKSTLDYDFIVKPTDAPHTKTTKHPQIKRTTTETFVPIKLIDSSREISSTEKLFGAQTVEPSYFRQSIPLFRDEEYDDYFVTTPKTTNSVENLDAQMESMKTNKMFSHDIEYENNLRKIAQESNPYNFHPVIQQNLDLSSMRKMADMIYLPQERIAKEWNYNTETKPPVSTYKKKKNDSIFRGSAKITNSVESNTSITDTKFSKSLKNSIKITSSIPDVKLEQLDTKFDSENLGEEEFQDEYGLKLTDTNTRLPYKYKSSRKKTTIETEKPPTVRDLLKHEEKIASKSPKSMLPSMRPVYLQIQRNHEWKQDDHADYDINFNNNIFDLPNIN